MKKQLFTMMISHLYIVLIMLINFLKANPYHCLINIAKHTKVGHIGRNMSFLNQRCCSMLGTSKDHIKRTPYSILEVPEDASQEQIKMKYYELAQRYHPDKSSSPNADKFKQISQAYAILKDSSKRKQLDIKIKQGGAFSFGANQTKYYSQYHYGQVKIDPNQRQKQSGKKNYDSPYPRPTAGEYFSTGIKFSQHWGKQNSQARVREKQGMVKNIFMVSCAILALIGVVQLIVRVYQFNRGVDKKYSEEIFGQRKQKGHREVRLNPKLRKEQYMI